jgi:phosphonate transport system ATP-binding protein
MQACALEHGMLVVEGLTCRFGTKAAVDNASFSIAPGGFVGVIGRSGAGKSTLLRTINCLATATEGRILYKGVDVTALRARGCGNGGHVRP